MGSLAHRFLATVCLAALALITIRVESPQPLGAELPEKGLTIITANSLTKVFADEPSGGKAADMLELSAARNEYEAGQIVLITGTKGFDTISLELSDLVHDNQKATITRHHLNYRFVGYTAPTRITSAEILTARKITDNKERKYPDPLLADSLVDLKANTVQPVWVTVYVPAQTPAGNYACTVNVKAGEQVIAKIALKVHVWDFSLPESTPLFVWYYSDFNAFAKNWLDVTPVEWDAYKTAFRHYVREIARHRGSITLPLKYDARGFEEIMEILSEEGVEYWWVTWLWGSDYVDADRANQERMAKHALDYMKQKGLLDSTFFVTWDEPDLRPDQEANRAKWKQHISVLKEAGLPKRQAEMTWRCQTATELMESYVNVWCPQFSYFDRIYYDFLQKRRKAGDIIGFYLTGSGTGQEPRHYIPFSLTEMRRLHYYLWHHGLTLCEFWALDVTWRKKGLDPFSMVVGGGYGGGTDALIYPNPRKDLTNPFLSSLRFEAIRDGIEDYCYLWILDKLVARARDQEAKDLAESGAKVLADVSQRLGKNLRDHHLTDPADYIEARKVLAETIVELKRDGPEVYLLRKRISY
ncbi:MAG: DUF4091 domain-containing protein [Planctomycetes bacterium]|nr:DUF4091 domain-containing protein [Planctomycetota bacterium]